MQKFIYTKSRLFQPHLLSVLFLGFFSGIPLALTGSTLQAWFTTADINLVTIGALSLIGLPYVWKFLWAPFLDRFSPPLGRRRGWIMLTQLALVLALFLISWYEPKQHLSLMCFLAVLISFFSASQDIAIDAYRTDILAPEEGGIGSAYFIFGYRMAMFMSGGIALIIADYWGWQITYQFMSGLMLCGIIMTYFIPAPTSDEVSPDSLLTSTRDALLDLATRKNILIILSLIITYKIGDAFALSLISTFLLHGLGFTLTQLGLALKTVSIVGTILGAMIGGAILLNIEIYSGLLWFGILQAISTGLFMLLAIIGKNYSLMILCLFIENFCSGMGTAAFLSFIMSCCNHKFSATQFAGLSALSAIGRVVIGPFAGLFVLHYGWTTFFGFSMLMALPGIFLVALLRHKVKHA